MKANIESWELTIEDDGQGSDIMLYRYSRDLVTSQSLLNVQTRYGGGVSLLTLYDIGRPMGEMASGFAVLDAKVEKIYACQPA